MPPTAHVQTGCNTQCSKTTHCDPIIICTTYNPECAALAAWISKTQALHQSFLHQHALALRSLFRALRTTPTLPCSHILRLISQTDACPGKAGRQVTATHLLPKCGRVARLYATNMHHATHRACSHAPDSCRSFACPRRKSCVLYNSALGRPRMSSISRSSLRAPAAVACGNSLVPLCRLLRSGPRTWTGHVRGHSRHQQPLTRRLPSGLFFRLLSTTSR